LPVQSVDEAVEEEHWQQEARKLCEKYVTYGYRRIQVLLKRAGYQVGTHKVRRWMREAGLSQIEPMRDDGRTPGEKPADPTGPNQAWQIDATKIHTKLDGWVWQTSILDVYDRRIVAHVVRKTSKAEDAMDTLAMALDLCFGEGKAEGLSLIHDRGSQFTAWSFKEMVSGADINNVAVAVHHPQSCGCLERYHRTEKEECIWLSEWESLPGVSDSVSEYVKHYNNERIHSALGYKIPMEVHRLAIERNSSLSNAA
jgi:putative transposase